MQPWPLPARETPFDETVLRAVPDSALAFCSGAMAHARSCLCACQMQSHYSSRPAPHRSRFRPSVRAAPTTPSADFCQAVKTSSPVFSRYRFRFNDTWQISRGKTRVLPRIDAGFTTRIPFADGGLGGHVPTGPECATPHIRFLFIVPRFRLGLPLHPASRRRTCPLANLRLCEYLVSGLSPDWTRAMHGTHVELTGGALAPSSDRRERG